MSKASAPKSSSRKTSPTVDSGTSNQSAMKTSEIRDLIDFISKSGLNEVNIETKELKLHVKRDPDQKVFKSTPVAQMANPMQAVSAPVAQPKAAAEIPVAAGKKTVEIKSPMIGTFYRSSNPDT